MPCLYRRPIIIRPPANIVPPTNIVPSANIIPTNNNNILPNDNNTPPNNIIPSNNSNNNNEPTIAQQRLQNQGKNTISAIIESYKAAVTKHANRLGLENGWQTRFPSPYHSQ
jgi:hypothetical protein